MVVVPVGALAWLGGRWVSEHASLAEHELTVLLEDRLRDVDATIGRFIEGQELALRKVAEDLPSGTADQTRDVLRGLGRPADVLVIDWEGLVVFPPLGGETSEAEREFLSRTRSVWEGASLLSEVRRAVGDGGRRARGWHGYYHGGGLNLLYWVADPERVVAVELPRIGLLSDLVAFLPATTTGEDDTTPYRTTLVDAGGQTVYAWGAYEAGSAAPQAVFPIRAPLSAWSLRHYGPPSDMAAGLTETLALNLALALGGVALALILLAVYLFRQRSREMRVARQRVSFVNQVSHELKTPLTNIRLYAELLAAALGLDDEDPSDWEDDPAGRHLAVITAESERLSRLIHNVLTFARDKEQRLELARGTHAVDDVVRGVHAAFAPAFEEAGIGCALALGAPEPASLDKDALGQVLANLLSNVVKYAASGGAVRIATRRDGDRVTLTVADRGPGIPAAQRERVFEPFTRLSDTLEEGVSGTGIGLDIARRLARLHGGDLSVAPAEVGATFVLSIDAPVVAG